MFPSRRHHRFSTALLEVAEAMLRPVPADADARGVDDDAWQWPANRADAIGVAAVHPHRRLPRIERHRRPGALSAPAQQCSSPLTPRSSREQRDPRGTASRA